MCKFPIFVRTVFHILFFTVVFCVPLFLIAQSSRCPFHRYTKSGTINENKEGTIDGQRRLSDLQLTEAVTQSNGLLSLPRWLLDRFNWNKNSIRESELNTEKNNVTKNEPWSNHQLFQLESDWDETNQDWQTKLNRIWTELSTSPPLSNHYPSLLEFVFRLVLLGDDFTRLRLPLTFRPYSNTQKVLHSAASYGRVLFQWTDDNFRSSYTGIFSEPTAEAIMSASAGNPFVANQSAAFGYGFKFFRSNISSATILSLNAFLGLGAYWNVFGYMSCNHASLAEMSVLIPTLPGWSKFPNQNGLRNVASYNLNGEPSRNPRFPYALCFVPNPHLTNRIGQPSTLSPLSSLQAQFKLIRPGERLFDIVAIFTPQVLSQPKLLLNSQFCRRVGSVVSLTPFTPSQFGDSRLFFQHQPFDDDLLLRPDWIPYMTLRNLVNEGALGAYRVLYTPPTPHLSDQIVALQSLAQFVIRLFTQPASRSWQFLGVTGKPSITDLLRFYILQGGPTTWRIISNMAFPKSNSIPLVDESIILDGLRSRSTLENLLSLLFSLDTELDFSRVTSLQNSNNPSITNAITSSRVSTFATGNDPIGHEKNSTSYLTQNYWPANTENDIIHEDEFLESLQRSLILSKYLERLLSSTKGKIPEWSSNFSNNNFNNNSFSNNNFSDNNSNSNNNNTDNRNNSNNNNRNNSDSNGNHVNVRQGGNQPLPDNSNSNGLNKQEDHDAHPRKLVGRVGDTLLQQPLLLFNERAVYLLLLEVNALLSSRAFHAFRRLLRLPQQMDPKLIVIHLLRPVFFAVTRETLTRDILFEQLQSAILGVSPPSLNENKQRHQFW